MVAPPRPGTPRGRRVRAPLRDDVEDDDDDENDDDEDDARSRRRRRARGRRGVLRRADVLPRGRRRRDRLDRPRTLFRRHRRAVRPSRVVHALAQRRPEQQRPTDEVSERHRVRVVRVQRAQVADVLAAERVAPEARRRESGEGGGASHWSPYDRVRVVHADP